jgi:hypothetical protein
MARTTSKLPARPSSRRSFKFKPVTSAETTAMAAVQDGDALVPALARLVDAYP